MDLRTRWRARKKNIKMKNHTNSILCTKGVKWAFLDRVGSLQHEPKASASVSRRRVLQSHEVKRPTKPLVHTIFFVTQVLIFAFFHLKRETTLTNFCYTNYPPGNWMTLTFWFQFISTYLKSVIYVFRADGGAISMFFIPTDRWADALECAAFL